MSKNKHANEPQILKDLKTIFNQGLTYEQFDEIHRDSCKTLPDKYKTSIYRNITNIKRTLSLNDNKATAGLIQMYHFYYWSKSKEIYDFDPDFAEELMQTELNQIPYELFKRLPYDTFAINIGNDYMIVHKCFDRNHIESDYLFISKMDSDEKYMHVFGYPISEQYDTVEKLKSICADPKQATDAVKYMNLILYLASEKADIEPNPEQKTITKRSSSKIRNVYREIRKWDVGVRFGSMFRKTNHTSIRQASNNALSHIGSAKRPHIRRAHWHSYWTGPKDRPDRQKLIVKWVSATGVNMADSNDNELPAVIHDARQ